MSDGDKIAKWESQVRKGALDFVVMICLENSRLYGYELICRLKEDAGLTISEGTIYPLLSRLSKEDLIESEWVEMPTGMPRKYYRLTPAGSEVLVDMKSAWKRFVDSIGGLLEQS